MDVTSYLLGKANGGGGSYELPIASSETLGGIKVGDNLSIDENGVLSSTGGNTKIYVLVDVGASNTSFDFDTEENREKIKQIKKDIVDGSEFLVLIQSKLYNVGKMVSPCKVYINGTQLVIKTAISIESVSTSTYVLSKYGINYSANYCVYIITTFNGDEITSIQGGYNNDVSSIATKSYHANQLPLGTQNTSSYTPTGDYNPATKKYVDDTVASAIGTALGGSY